MPLVLFSGLILIVAAGWLHARLADDTTDQIDRQLAETERPAPAGLTIINQGE